MTPITFHDIINATGGTPVGPPSDVPPLEAVCTDSSKMPGRPCVFVALKGARFDGHNFLADAARGGAVVAVVERAVDNPPAELRLVRVADTYAALGHLARLVRKTLKGKVIAVGGSNGKTGTKGLIDAALRGSLRGSVSPKSFNNNVGVPLTIFAADPADHYLVLEIGTNYPGEIRPLSEAARPDVAVITSIGAEHLEGLGDLAGVRRENAFITAGLSPCGTLIYNGDDQPLREEVAPFSGEKVTFGFDPSNHLFAADVRIDESGVRFLLNGRQPVFVPLLGKHIASNALAAFAVGRVMGVTDDAIVDGLSRATGPDMRLQLSKAGDVTILNDAYNANPHSVRAALDTLAALSPGPSGRRVAVLGDMRELGDAAEKYHREAGEYAVSGGRADLLVCVGEQAGRVADAAVAEGLPADAVHRYATAVDAAGGVPGLLAPGDLVLLKASRAVRLEAVADAIVRGRAGAASQVSHVSRGLV